MADRADLGAAVLEPSRDPRRVAVLADLSSGDTVLARVLAVAVRQFLTSAGRLGLWDTATGQREAHQRRLTTTSSTR